MRYVTPKEFRALLQECRTICRRTPLTLLYTTGLRRGELAHLTWADVDFEHNRIRVVSKEASGLLVSWEPKDHEGRLLPVPAEVMRLLSNLQSDAAEGCPYVFVPSWRWRFSQEAPQRDEWPDGQLLLDSLNRRLAIQQRRARVTGLEPAASE